MFQLQETSTEFSAHEMLTSIQPRLLKSVERIVVFKSTKSINKQHPTVYKNKVRLQGQQVGSLRTPCSCRPGPPLGGEAPLLTYITEG